MARLWWKRVEIEVPPLPAEHAREIVRTYIARQGMLIESPGLFVGHFVQQSGGNPQALADLLADSSKERPGIPVPGGGEGELTTDWPRPMEAGA